MAGRSKSNRNLKVLFISSSSGSRGGGELYLLFLGEALTHLGVEVGLWCSTHSRMDELATSFNKIGKVYRSDYKNTYDYRGRSLSNIFARKIEGVLDAIREFHPDIIHLNKQNTEDGIDLIQTLDRVDTPFVTTIHITQTQKSLGAVLGSIRDLISRRSLHRSKSATFITVSGNRMLDLKSFLRSRRNKVVMIPNGVSIPRELEAKSQVRKRAGIPDDILLIVTVGRLEPQKDPMKFIDWAVQCLALNRAMKFYWIGDGSMRNDFETKIAEFGLRDTVKCLGWMKDVSLYYNLADIYVHTAAFEGLPFSLLEALSWRLPCAVSTGLYNDLSFPEGVINNDIAGLKNLIENKNELTESADLGFQYVARYFSIEVISRAYLKLYEEVIQGGGKQQ